jgi:serine/threonine protein kinase
MNKKKLSEPETRIIMEQLLLTIDFMHRRNIIHRDIKLDNVLINESSEDCQDSSGIVVKIADFGLSCFIEPDTLMHERCGTPCYVAPEILRDLGYDTKSDLFSIGSVMFNLVCGRFLFKGANKQDLL